MAKFIGESNLPDMAGELIVACWRLLMFDEASGCLRISRRRVKTPFIGITTATTAAPDDGKTGSSMKLTVDSGTPSEHALGARGR